MSLAIRPASGTVISVSATLPTSFDQAAYEAIMDWKAITGADNIGELGTSVGTGNFTPLDGAQQFYRTIRTAEAFEMSPADLPSDPGQELCKTAANAAPGASAESLAIRVQDTGGHVTYCTALVTKAARMYGGSEDLQKRMISMQPDPSSFVEVAPV